MKKENKLLFLIAGIVITIAAVTAGVKLTSRPPKGTTIQVDGSAEDSTSLEEMLSRVSIYEADRVLAPIEAADEAALQQELPDLEEADYTVRGRGDVDLMIFSSPEKSGEEKDGWLSDLARQFNQENHHLGNGKSVSVSVVNVNSGLASDYIISDKYTPDLFTPSSSLWASLIEADGKTLSPLMESTVANTAGVAVKKEKYQQLIKEYGTVSLKTIVEATEAGDLVTGYTDPFTSTTGMNFLISTLSSYDHENVLSDEAKNGFIAFQKNIPFVATNTQQMMKSAAKGTFDAFVIEEQQMNNSPELSEAYQFVPFGYLHDNPLYAVSTLSEEKKEAVDLFTDLLKSDKAKELAQTNGFTGAGRYVSELKQLDGSTLKEAQQLWKSEKDSGKTIAAMFIADVSGSMDGQPLKSLQDSLINGMRYISDDSYIGLMSFSDDVMINAPLGLFDLTHQAEFKGGIQSLEAGGGTAMYDALAVAIYRLQQFEERHPELDVKPLIFLLSDGETNEGYTLKDLQASIKDSKYPIYTIGYNANLPALKEISDLNEAASLDADNDDIISKLKSLFNANL